MQLEYFSALANIFVMQFRLIFLYFVTQSGSSNHRWKYWCWRRIPEAFTQPLQQSGVSGPIEWSQLSVALSLPVQDPRALHLPQHRAIPSGICSAVSAIDWYQRKWRRSDDGWWPTRCRRHPGDVHTHVRELFQTVPWNIEMWKFEISYNHISSTRPLWKVRVLDWYCFFFLFRHRIFLIN